MYVDHATPTYNTHIGMILIRQAVDSAGSRAPRTHRSAPPPVIRSWKQSRARELPGSRSRDCSFASCSLDSNPTPPLNPPRHMAGTCINASQRSSRWSAAARGHVHAPLGLCQHDSSDCDPLAPRTSRSQPRGAHHRAQPSACASMVHKISAWPHPGGAQPLYPWPGGRQRTYVLL